LALFRVRPLAWREINSQLDHLEEQAGLETAERFLDQLMGSFQALADMPKMGFFLWLSQTVHAPPSPLARERFRELDHFLSGNALWRRDCPCHSWCARYRSPAEQIMTKLFA
jgi:plasmid stabilization system protein ParE